MDSLDRLARMFRDFPGIGERQAMRFVHFLLSSHSDYKKDLLRAISELDHKVTQCVECFRYFEEDGHERCDICESSHTDKSVLLVLEKDADVKAIVASRAYQGGIFIIGSVLPLGATDTKKTFRRDELLKRIEAGVKSGVLKEVILGFSLTPHGEHTTDILRQMIQMSPSAQSLKVSSWGKGFSTGTEVEYSDSETLLSALENRK